MKPLLQKVRMVGAALILASVLSASGLPQEVVVNAQSEVTWDIHSEVESHQTSSQNGDTQVLTSKTEQHSSDGQDITSKETREVYEDGSSHDHEEFTYSDGKGKKGSFRRDEYKDSKGNRKIHYEETWAEDDRCETYIYDEEYDSNNHLIQRTEKSAPCGEFRLEVFMDGGLTADGMTIQYGPNTATIPLELKDDIYTGRYEGFFYATYSGKCNGSVTYPIIFDVTAIENEFEELDITMKNSIGISLAVRCEDSSSSANKAPMTGTVSYSLPRQDGASKTFSSPGGITVIYTLKNGQP